MQSGDLVTVRAFTGGPVWTMVPDDPLGDGGIVIPPGTPAMVIEPSAFMTRVLMTCGAHWIFNDNLEADNESR